MTSILPSRSGLAFLPLDVQHQRIRDEIDEAYRRVLDRGQFILGPELSAFEEEFAAYCGARFCVGVGNGFDALMLVLRAWGIGPGDEVLVPAHTFVATWMAVSAVGATPVPVDVDAGTYTLCLRNAAAQVTGRTKAVIPVHLYGHPCDIDAVHRFAASRHLQVLDDAAQAHGAMWDGRHIGSMSGAAAYSFYPGKNLGALGDAGAVTTDDPALAAKLRLLRNYGASRKYHHEVVGPNSRLDELQAAFLRVKLHHLPAWNARRAEIANRYLQGLVTTGLGLPIVHPSAIHVWHLFVIQHPDRDAFKKRLEQAGVESVIHYPTVPAAQPAYAHLQLDVTAFPVAASLQHKVISLPINPTMTDDEVDFVIRTVKDAAFLD